MTLAPAPGPRSPAQREAARRNGARSNGPVTAEGKARASQNALRHGLCSPAILFPGEDPARFEALRAALEAEYEPASPSVHFLVERLAVTVRKLARCDRLEARLAAIEPHCPTGRPFPDPGLPRVLSRIPALATLLRHQAQLDRQLHRLLRSLAERPRDRFASPGEDPAPAGDGPEADGEPDPVTTPVPPKGTAAARATAEAVGHDGAAGLANPSNEAEPGPLRVDQGAAVEPALSATEAGCPATARPERPNEPEPEAIGPGARAAVHPARSGTSLASAGTTRRDTPNEPEPARAAPGEPVPIDPDRGSPLPRTAAVAAGNAAPNLRNEPGPGLSTSRAGIAFNVAQCFGNEAEPVALLARGDLTGYLRARKALERPGPPHPTPPSHPPARGKPGP